MRDSTLHTFGIVSAKSDRLLQRRKIEISANIGPKTGTVHAIKQPGYETEDKELGFDLLVGTEIAL